MLLQILAGVAAVVGATGLLPTAPGLPGWPRYPFVFYGLVYVTLLLLSVAWWRDARLALIGILTGPILVPVCSPRPLPAAPRRAGMRSNIGDIHPRSQGPG
jgi:hypothetical protein